MISLCRAWCFPRDLNPQSFRPMFLKHRCIPVPSRKHYSSSSFCTQMLQSRPFLFSRRHINIGSSSQFMPSSFMCFLRESNSHAFAVGFESTVYTIPPRKLDTVFHVVIRPHNVLLRTVDNRRIELLRGHCK